MAKTKKEMFAEIREVVIDNAEMVAFIDHEIELLSRKRTGTGNTKAKAETEARAEKVYAELVRMEEPVTVTEFLALATDEEVKGYTNQRVSALFRKLGERVVKTTEGKKAKFAVA